MRKFKWYDWIPIVGYITTKWGSVADGYSHGHTLLWGLYMIVTSFAVAIALVYLINIVI